MSSSVSQGRLTREGRRLPFFVVTKPATATIRREFPAKQVTTALAVYATLIESANDEGSDTFEAQRALLAVKAGVHVSTLTKFANKLAEAGLLKIERRKAGSANLPNVWTLVDPPLLASDEEGVPEATPPRVKRGGGSSSQTMDLLVSGEEGSSSQARVVKEQPTKEQETAANAAAAGAGAPDSSPVAAGSSSSSGPVGDPGKLLWPTIRVFLGKVGFDEQQVESDKAKIRALVNRRRAEMEGVDWVVLAEQVAALRKDGTCYSTTPVGVLGFAIGQRGDEHRKKPGRAKGKHPSSPPIGPADLRSPLPAAAPDSDLDRAWAAILADARAQIGDHAWDTWLSVMRPVAADGQVVWASAPDHAQSWIQARLLPLLSASASRVLNRPLQVQLCGESA